MIRVVAAASVLPFSGSIAGGEPVAARILTPMPRRSACLRIALLGLLASTLPRAAPAGDVELCVTCAGPAAVYRCVAELPGTSKTADARAQMACATELATAGGHQSCSVARVAAACEGPSRSVKMSASPAAPVREAEAQAGSPALTATDTVKTGESPAVAEGASPGAAGERAKSTWTCLASFFKDC